jgi:hypothetical protein
MAAMRNCRVCGKREDLAQPFINGTCHDCLREEAREVEVARLCGIPLDAEKRCLGEDSDGDPIPRVTQVVEYYQARLENAQGNGPNLSADNRYGFTVSEIAVIIGGALIVISLLFPPWLYTFQTRGISQVRKPAGYGFLLAPPAPEHDNVIYGISLDWSRLSAQVVMLALLTAICWFGARRSPRRYGRQVLGFFQREALRKQIRDDLIDAIVADVADDGPRSATANQSLSRQGKPTPATSSYLSSPISVKAGQRQSGQPSLNPSTAKLEFWSLRINSIEDARKVIRESAIWFYVVAGILAAVAILARPLALVDAALLAGFAVWLHCSQSRIPATLLLCLAGISVVATASNQLDGRPGGQNVILAVALFWASVRAVAATYKLPGLLTR